MTGENNSFFPPENDETRKRESLKQKIGSAALSLIASGFVAEGINSYIHIPSISIGIGALAGLGLYKVRPTRTSS